MISTRYTSGFETIQHNFISLRCRNSTRWVHRGLLDSSDADVSNCPLKSKKSSYVFIHAAEFARYASVSVGSRYVLSKILRYVVHPSGPLCLSSVSVRGPTLLHESCRPEKVNHVDVDHNSPLDLHTACRRAGTPHRYHSRKVQAA